MKKFIIITVLALVASGFLFREPLGEMTEAWATRNMFVPIEAATFQPGPDIGTPLTELQAHHQGRSITTIDEFSRGNGTVLIALRSLDWCAYCKRQIIDLQEYKSFFDVFGIGLVAITNDLPEAQQPFIERHTITIPVLSDAQSKSFQSLGILNTDYKPGDAEYGLPHPGAIIVNREGIIMGKLFVENPNLRVFSSEMLDYAKQTLGLRGLFE
jgi:peroxiredoxin